MSDSLRTSHCTGSKTPSKLSEENWLDSSYSNEKRYVIFTLLLCHRAPETSYDQHVTKPRSALLVMTVMRLVSYFKTKTKMLYMTYSPVAYSFDDHIQSLSFYVVLRLGQWQLQYQKRHLSPMQHVLPICPSLCQLQPTENQ